MSKFTEGLIGGSVDQKASFCKGPTMMSLGKAVSGKARQNKSVP